MTTTRPTTVLRRRMIQDLQLAGRGERTQEAYVRAVRKLATHFHQSPDQLTETQIRDYFLYLKNDCKFSPSALKIAHSGIKFFYTHSMPREWATLLKLRVPKHKTLPDVLTVDEVQPPPRRRPDPAQPSLSLDRLLVGPEAPGRTRRWPTHPTEAISTRGSQKPPSGVARPQPELLESQLH
jgi:hypothetical protein